MSPSWPAGVAPELLHRAVDVEAILRIEGSGAAAIEAWQAHQWRILRDWLRLHTPWWAERLGPETADWASRREWPVHARRELQAMVERHGAAPVPPHHGPVLESATSGSSGVPVRFFVSAFAQRLINHQYRADERRQGRRPFGSMIIVDQRTPEHPGQPHILQPENFAAGAGRMLRRRLDLSRLLDDAVWLREHRPRYIFGWVAWLEQLLEQAERQGWALPDSVEQVCPYGATVLPALRERIHRQLGADVRDRYSCEECGPLAFQCPHDERYYHVAVAHVALDTVDDAGRPCAEGVAGRVLVTALHHYGTPLIRYDVGDAAALHAHCPGCGEQIQALSQLWGRRRFLLREPDGTRLFARTESHWWLRCAPVLEHRLVQTTPTDVQAEVVMARPLTDAEAEAIVRMLREVVSPRLAYHVRQVERIDKTGSYKRQDIISLLE